MPIINKKGERLGVTEVLNKREGPFTVKDEQRMRAFTAQMAVALENAQLFDEVLSVKRYNENILASTTNGVVTLDNAGRVETATAPPCACLAWRAAPPCNARPGRCSARKTTGSCTASSGCSAAAVPTSPPTPC